MSLQDPVSDMLTVIRNAQRANHEKTKVPHSTLKARILEVLVEEGYLTSFEVTGESKKRDLLITLKYYQDKPVIEKINRVSKPSLRIYRGSNDLPTVRGGLGISIVSTPKGVMSDRVARAENVGGEVLCTVE